MQGARHQENDGGREEILGVKVTKDRHSAFHPQLRQEAVGTPAGMDACFRQGTGQRGGLRTSTRSGLLELRLEYMKKDRTRSQDDTLRDGPR